MDTMIYAFTRQNAIEDGLLVELEGMAKECGFRIPVAVTIALWDGFIVPPEDLKYCQDSDDRAWDVLNCLRNAVARSKGDSNIVRFSTLFQMTEKEHQETKLKAICGPGDDGNPVITVMLPKEG